MKLKQNITKNKVLVLVLVLLASSLLGYLLLVLVYAIPTNKMDKHVLSSVYFFEREGGGFPVTNRDNGQLDGSTDAVMLLEAANMGTGNPFLDALYSNYASDEDASNGALSLVSIYKGTKNVEDIQTVSYARYWHGYLVFLKPLLYFCNYGEIRTFIAMSQILLIIGFVYLGSLNCKDLIIPMVVFWISLNPISTMMSLQYNTIFMITLVASSSIMIMKNGFSRNSIMWYVLFEMIGIATSYMDFLTYPIVSLAIPLLIWCFLFNESVTKDIIRVLAYSVCYGIGYIGMWASKWILGSLLTNNNIVLDAIGQVKLRSSNSVGDETISLVRVILEQFKGFIQYPIIILLFVGIISILFWTIRDKDIKSAIKRIIIPAIIGLYPYVWYAVTKNHSYCHPYITCRELSITAFAFAMIVVILGQKTIKSQAKE